MPGGRLRPFPDIRQATFVRRPNRFVVECTLDGHRIAAYMPNPGRLWELLLPGRTLFLADAGTAGGRKYRYTAVAVVRDGTPILLHTHRSNDVARWLLEQKKLPGLEDATIVKAEVTAGRSRFDFLLHRQEKPFFLEVKSCTQFGRNIAMFPDAVTERGRRHLVELASHADRGTPGGVVFLVHWTRADYFLPDYHTDLEFARTLLTLRKRIFIRALAVGWDHDMVMDKGITELTIPWHIVKREAQDGGSYLLIIDMQADRTIDIGKLGPTFFQRGYYIYVGSARRHLTKRIDRHLRKRKNHFWHIDYLRHRADGCTALPVRTTDDLECILSKAVAAITRHSIPGFGSSDCSCPSHLFYMEKNPLHDDSFIDTLLHFRMHRLHEQMTLI